ncbi:MAG: hypothetical protein IJU71_06865, partial [Selenomonadaceae bacterium]|nr:hypothetical protein [Selenomonadaceae bacterium]
IELFKDDPQSRVERIFKRMIDPDKLYIVCTYRLGDMLFVGGLSHAMSERFDKSSVVLIVKDRLRSLELSFDGVSEIKYAANDDLQAFQDRCRETNIYLGHNWIYGHYAYNEDGEHMYSGRLNFLDRYRSDILGLPLDTPYRPPHIRDISDEAKAKLQTDYILDKNRTVIIAPVTNTYRDLRKDFWHRIVERLQQSDAIVYTNIGRNNRGELEPPLEGTAPLNVSLNEMFWLADKVKCIIGFRSGLFDLLAFSKAKLLCIAYGSYHNDINLMFPNNPSRLVTLYLVRKIDSERLARWKINADNVFTDADALSESLLRDVLGDRVFSRD